MRALDLAHAGLDLGALGRVLVDDLEVVVELGVVRGDRQRAPFHDAQARQAGRELHDRIVGQAGHGVVARARGLAQQHREHRHGVGAVGVDEARAVAEQAVASASAPMSKPLMSCSQTMRDAVVVAGARERATLAMPPRYRMPPGRPSGAPGRRPGPGG
jgi:hypothetical protein